MKLRIAAASFAAALALSTVALAGAAPGNGNGNTKIYICHNTASETNPVVVIHVGQPAEKGHITGNGQENGNQPHNKNGNGEDFSSSAPIPVDQGEGRAVCVGPNQG